MDLPHPPTEPTETTKPAEMATTPAGGQINADWGQLSQGIMCLTVFLCGTLETTNSAAFEEWHVVFRCGTVVRVADNDPEFPGYTPKSYRFPENTLEDASATEEVMADNKRVWEAQRSLPEPAGKPVRQAYAKMLSQGYPYPGGPTSDRSTRPTGVQTEADGLLWTVFWPGLDRTGKVYNLAFSQQGPGTAVVAGGDLRRYDYMFPEVAAVISKDLKVWTYGPDKTFSDKHPL